MVLSAFKVGVISVLMGCTCYGLHRACGARFAANTLGDKLAALGIPLGAGLLVFFGLAHLIGLKELDELKESLWRRRRS